MMEARPLYQPASNAIRCLETIHAEALAVFAYTFSRSNGDGSSLKYESRYGNKQYRQHKDCSSARADNVHDTLRTHRDRSFLAFANGRPYEANSCKHFTHLTRNFFQVG